MKACISIAIIIAQGLLQAGAAEQQIICPTEIPQAAIKLTSVPGQWTPHVASPLYLSSAGAAAGPPEQRATLMGDSTWQQGKTEWVTTYDLSDESFHAGKWMECRYGEYGQILLSRQLDPQTKFCKVHFSKSVKAGQRFIKIVCQSL
ncbi:hypothetical protein FHW58_002296 [Duganella sp. 1224]|uniref:STY0301 family protein n=1 Tax=Duganella sp. 1224 TaxID=2587052 RepID=UPI0015CB1943|nr:STY0301 family protein [Duganella sp. 1224]NYE61144.1 hypothetical protein [Duganella sp. 1224]